jgi:UDP-N-acetylglucosamine 2-epimerase
VRAANVVDVGYSRGEILEGIKKAISPGFRGGLDGLINPYGDGQAAERIVNALATAKLDERLVRKRFYSPDEEGSVKDVGKFHLVRPAVS